MNNKGDNNNMYEAEVLYEVCNIPGRDNGFQETCTITTNETDESKIESEAFEYLAEYFNADNFMILGIGVCE